MPLDSAQPPYTLCETPSKFSELLGSEYFARGHFQDNKWTPDKGTSGAAAATGSRLRCHGGCSLGYYGGRSIYVTTPSCPSSTSKGCCTICLLHIWSAPVNPSNIHPDTQLFFSRRHSSPRSFEHQTHRPSWTCGPTIWFVLWACRTAKDLFVEGSSQCVKVSLFYCFWTILTDLMLSTM